MVSATKRCSLCGLVKPLDEFHRRRGAKDGRQARCRPCNIETNKRWYREHPEVRARRMYGYAQARRQNNRVRILEHLRANPCLDCGEADPVVLDFDHLRDKVRNVSSMMNHRWDAIAAEIEKCEVVCANCHRRRTAARLGAFRWLVTQDSTQWG